MLVDVLFGKGAEATIHIPAGNYSVTIMEEDGKRYVTVTADTYTQLDW
jgi:hypothetical protein